MGHQAPDDEPLAELVGRTIAANDDVSYRIGAVLGSGGTAVAHQATRVTPQGETAVVLKVLRPWFVRRAAKAAMLAVRKEAVALGRLNERVPPTPFVVRLVDSGFLPTGTPPVEVPWLAIEYVHGGAEGTTLAERVQHSISVTGSAFDPARVALMVDCVAHGLGAVHEVGVIHRDIKPANILCCGFGDQEVFKVSDFGIARPQGMETTFGGLLVGTPGYAAPEQASYDEGLIGPWTDVFGFAAAVYFALTGDDYFPLDRADDAVKIVRAPARRKLVQGSQLCAELQERPATCDAIDRVLASATAARRDQRPQSAEVLAAMLSPLLKLDSEKSRVATARARAPIWDGLEHEETTIEGWVFALQQQPNVLPAIRSVAWDGDGRCLALGASGLCLWTGLGWVRGNDAGLPPCDELRFVHRVGPGRWLLGGDKSTLATYSWEGARSVVRGPDPNVSMELASGELDGLAVMAASHGGGERLLYAMAGKRWMRPLPLPGIAHLSHLARIADAAWLVAGRTHSGEGILLTYHPLELEVREVQAPSGALPELVACIGQAELGLWAAATSAGEIVWSVGGAVTRERLRPGSLPRACAIDPSGGCWVADEEGLWFRRLARERGDWTLLSRLPRIADRVIAMTADVGIVRALTASGGLIEGRQISGSQT